MLSVGLACVAAGATILTVAGALWVRDVARRRPFADVLDNIEPPRVVMPLRCICPARLPFCGCAIDGVRNPRGAGRARQIEGADRMTGGALLVSRGRAWLLQDAIRRQLGENIDGSPRRETLVRDLDAEPWGCPVGVCKAPDGCTTPRVCRAVEALR